MDILYVAPATPLTDEQKDILWARHEARLRLIYAPFPQVRRLDQTAMTWAGTIVGDRFYGSGEAIGRKRKGDNNEDPNPSYEGVYSRTED